MNDLLINLLASVVAGAAVWLTQHLLRLRRLARKRAFFGVSDGSECLLAVSRHKASPHELSVHRRDVAAVVELATIIRDCGGRAELVAENDLPHGLGRLTEFCVGGPLGNARTAAHFRSILRGVLVEHDPRARLVTYTIGPSTFGGERGAAEYVVLARAWGPARGRPVFILGGQTAGTNLAAARYLSRNYRELYRRYGAAKPFCVVMRVAEGAAYGPDFIETVAEVSDEAFRPRRPAASDTSSAPAQPEAQPG